jgi:hypothetical protein
MSIKRSLICSLGMLLAIATPVAAAPSPGGSAPGTAREIHVGTCDDITIAANGTISVNGVALTAAQAALLSADARAALRLAADADANANADVCADVTASLAPLSVAVNADIVICGSVVATADSATVGGVAIPAALLSAGLREALDLAADANVGTCLTTTVTNGNVTTQLTVDACVQAQLNSAGQVVATAGGQDHVLAGFALVGTTGALNANAAVDLGLRLGAGLNLANDAQTLTVQVITIAGCGAASPGGVTNPGGGTTTTGAAGPATGLAGTGGPMLPDTAMQPGRASIAPPMLAMIALLLIALAARRTQEVRSR